MTHDHEALMAILNEAEPTISRQGNLILLDCPDGTITDDLFEALEAACSGDLIHRSKISEETARAGEAMRERCERAALSLKQEPSGERHDASRDRAIGRRNRVLAEVGSLIRALPLTKEAADANR